MDTENKSLNLPASRNREPHFSLTREAGFSHFEKLDIRSQTNLFYAAKP